jgi:hypothetical protein
VEKNFVGFCKCHTKLTEVVDLLGLEELQDKQSLIHQIKSCYDAPINDKTILLIASLVTVAGPCLVRESTELFAQRAIHLIIGLYRRGKARSHGIKRSLSILKVILHGLGILAIK